MAAVQYKLSRCVKNGPSQRTPEELRRLEKGFVLDNIAVSTFSDDSGRANPKMSTAIPPYNSQIDSHTKNYFEKKLVQRLLTRTQQVFIWPLCIITPFSADVFAFQISVLIKVSCLSAKDIFLFCLDSPIAPAENLSFGKKKRNLLYSSYVLCYRL
jgi:hypothetical protein